jgi:hypothetical protein
MDLTWTLHQVLLNHVLSVNCASIHRKIGTHITKVCVSLILISYPLIYLSLNLNSKSLTMDDWTKEQVEVSRN